ncbi:MAG: dephospho-CoA kinase [Pseudomonadota bacterium]
MILIGLTGGIGMGKTTTAALFAEHGFPVWDADQAVHRLYTPGGMGVAPVLERFPDAGGPLGGINRASLADAVLGKPEELAALEAIVHPLVGADQMAFVEVHRLEGKEAAVLDIPLLLEGDTKEHFDVIVVCSAPEFIRKERVMAREGMTEERYAAIVARQMPDEEKKSHADYVVPTGEGLDKAREAVSRIVTDIRAKALDGMDEQPQN